MTNFVATGSNLTAKQEAFCHHFILSNNGTKAAIAAGYDPNSAAEIAHENLTKLHIQARIQAIKESTGSDTAPDSTIATLRERRQALTKIIKHNIDAPVSAGHIIAATHELSVLDGTIKPQAVAVDARVVNVYVMDAETKTMLEQAASRTTSNSPKALMQGKDSA